MASTSYLSRVLYKEHTTDGDFTGSYKLMVAAKSIPAPFGAPNTVESTTLENDTQTFEMGVKTSSVKEITGNYVHADLAAINALAGTKLDIIQLIGTDGLGGEGKFAYIGTATATPNDISGTDSIVEMTVSVVPNTVPEDKTSALTVTYNSATKTFTVATASA